MSENDAFNALKKSTFDTVHNECMLFPRWHRDDLTPTVKKHGWTYMEFWDECYKRFNDRSGYI
jgi:hypothetical protein